MAMANLYFSWRKFCEMHNIPYVEKGPNTARGHISVKCPFCGNADPSHHMGLKLDPKEPLWGCMRDPAHRGGSPLYLIQQFLRCSTSMARSILYAQRPELDRFAERVAAMQKIPDEEEEPSDEEAWWKKYKLKFPTGYASLCVPGVYPGKFRAYLSSRGFLEPLTKADLFGLRYVTSGPFQWRVLIPFYHRGVLVGWTGRSIQEREGLRYLTLPSSTEGAPFRFGKALQPALTDPSSYIMSQDRVEMGGQHLVLVEGPLDWLKLQWFKPRSAKGVVESCFFGMPKQNQVLMLGRLRRRFEHCTMVLDDTAQGPAFAAAGQIQELSGMRVTTVSPSKFGVGDPGEMNEKQVGSFYASLK